MKKAGYIYRGEFDESSSKSYRVRQLSRIAKTNGRIVRYYHCFVKDPNAVKTPKMKTVRQIKEADKAVRARKSLWDRLFGDPEE